MKHKLLFLVAFVAIAIIINGLAVAQGKPFVFGIVMVGPKDDHGWSQSHYEAGRYIEKTIPNTKMLFFEKLNVADTPETTLSDVVTQMVDNGAELIITTSDEFEKDTDKVAPQFPDVVFINSTGDTVLEKTAPANVGNYNSWFEIGRAIGGCAAALQTNTGNIGYLGALINQETRRHASAAYLGARYCYEKYAGKDPARLKFTVTWIGFWFNIPGVTLDPTEVSNSFFDSGADVVLSGIDTTEALQVAGKRTDEGQKVWAVPTDNPNGCDEAPKACLGAPYYNWRPGYSNLVKEVMTGKWTQKWDWQQPNWKDLNNLDTSNVGYTFGPGLSDESAKMLKSFIYEMAAYAQDPSNAGSMFLWQGPLRLQDGTQLAKETEKVPLLDIWRLPQLLQSMVGASSQE